MDFSPDVTDPGPLGKEPADEQTQRDRGLFEQLYDDARFTTLRLPVRRLQGPVVISIQEEERLAAGHCLEHLRESQKSKLKTVTASFVLFFPTRFGTCLSSDGGSASVTSMG